ncbi:molybdopterin synthase [Haladaptatus sp. F3-133]|jgi:molybdopterin synthase catalytic subunit|uniref:Molybdopterin synthase n=1 Tax=Halorutilus salinus TaxID=2487751 RepID=A0A9Q4C409_9EURY|nr:molybdopterin synthase [Halorutilus salinus]MCX2819462.1 molybdopterin synthase [Halorutilus salinus]
MKAVCVVGSSDSGKTTLVERLVPALNERGETATVKSIHHDVRVDEEGKDTYRHSEAGAGRVVGVTPERRFSFSDVEDKLDALAETLDDLADDGYDYAVVEGGRDTTLPKIAVGETGARNVVMNDGDEAETQELVDVVENAPRRETLGSLVRRVEESDDSERAGAVATFTGRVREENLEDARTTRLEYEKYDDVADDRMDAIRDDIESREGVYEVEMYHETGVVRAEEDAVHVVVLAGHRAEAFSAVEDAINRLKGEVPIFKKEVTEDGEFWVHDRP